MRSRRGFGAILSMIIVALSLVLGCFFLRFAQNYLENSAQFLGGLSAQNLAEAGIWESLAKVRQTKSFPEQEDYYLNKSVLFLSSRPIGVNGNYKVYLTFNGKYIMLLSIGEFAGIKRQVVADLYFSKEERKYLILQWHNE